ncbi:hypothetical protein PAMP_013219 [Pampus punctatissimus]
MLSLMKPLASLLWLLVLGLLWESWSVEASSKCCLNTRGQVVKTPEISPGTVQAKMLYACCHITLSRERRVQIADPLWRRQQPFAAVRQTANRPAAHRRKSAQQVSHS